MSLRDMCVLEPATAAPRKSRRKIGGGGSEQAAPSGTASGFAGLKEGEAAPRGA